MLKALDMPFFRHAESFGRKFQGWTDLHLAADSGELSRTRIAVQKGGDVNVRTQDGQTALHLAAAKGHQAIVGELLDRGARADIVDNAGATALHAAAESGNEAVVRILLGPRNKAVHREVLRDAKDRGDYSALMRACEAGREEAVKRLLEAGASPTDRLALTGRGTLHVAAAGGHVGVLALLVAAGAPLTWPDMAGDTPLHMAAAAGHLAAARWIMDRLADVRPKNKEGQTPQQLARAEGHALVMSLLVEEAERRDRLAAAASPITPVHTPSPVGWPGAGGPAANGNGVSASSAGQGLTEPGPERPVAYPSVSPAHVSADPHSPESLTPPVGGNTAKQAQAAAAAPLSWGQRAPSPAAPARDGAVQASPLPPPAVAPPSARLFPHIDLTSESFAWRIPAASAGTDAVAS